MYYQNVRGLRSKINEFSTNIDLFHYDLFALTETWLHDDIFNSELFSPSFKVIRADRNCEATGRTRGGGVLLASRSEFDLIQLDVSAAVSAAPSIDIIGARVIKNGVFVFNLFVIYIPPFASFETYTNFFDAFSDLNCFISEDKNILIGDYNIPGYCLSTSTDRLSTLLRDYESLLNMTQYNFIPNVNGRLLDLVLSSLPCHVTSCPEEIVSIDPHHPPLNIQISTTSTHTPQFTSNITYKSYNFIKANFPLLYQSICDIDWTALYNFQDVNGACNLLYSELHKVFDQHVPITTIKSTKVQNPPWFSTKIIKLLKQKQTAHKRYKQTHSRFYYNKFKFLRSCIKRELHSSYHSYLTKTENNLTTNPKKFWSFIRQKKGQSFLPGIMRDSSNNTFENGLDIVNAFRNYFQSVYIESSSNNLPTNNYIQTNASGAINVTRISEEEICRAFCKFSASNTCGNDGIPAFLIKDCKTIFVAPLLYIFNLILQTEKFPNSWKTARLCPIFKNGDKSVINNYRPISILNNFSKLFEYVIYNQIYFQVKPIISAHQHGFTEKRSTVTNLTQFTQFTCESLDSRGQVDCIYLDISKAFDQIDLHILLYKLQVTGFSDKLINILQSYLFNRTGFVVVDYTKSLPLYPTSGVPQGSTLGPLLFLLYINDIVSCISSDKLLFADDLKIYRNVSSPEDCSCLQSDIESINDWCIQNRLKLNLAKTTVITYTRKQQPVIFDYHVNNIPLSRATEIKDLGVKFDSSLTFNYHVNELASSCFKILGFIFRTCKSFKNINTFKSLFYSLIRSKLEYCCIVWSPFYQADISRIESLQRTFLKYLTFICEGSYPARGVEYRLLLNKFDCCSLLNRRLIMCAKFLFDIVNNKVDCSFILAKITFLVPRINARDSLLFYCDTPSSNMLVKSPIYNMCNLYNKYLLSSDIFFDKFSKIQLILSSLTTEQ